MSTVYERTAAVKVALQQSGLRNHIETPSRRVCSPTIFVYSVDTRIDTLPTDRCLSIRKCALIIII